MNISYGIATKENINELIKLRIDYMIDDFGSVSKKKRKGWRSSFRIILKENSAPS